MLLSPGGLCKSHFSFSYRSRWELSHANDTRHTYGDNEGEDTLKGFEPSDSPFVVDPTIGGGHGIDPDDKFAVGDVDAESPGAQESREWQESRDETSALKPKYGVPDEEGFENVWGESPGASEARENP